MKKMKPTFQFVSKLIDDHFSAPTCSKDDKSEYAREEDQLKEDMTIFSKIEKTLTDFEFDSFDIVNIFQYFFSI